MTLTAEQIVKDRERSLDLRRNTMVIVKELRDKYIDVKRRLLTENPEWDTPEGRARLSRVLSGITADSKVFALLQKIKSEQK